MGPLDGRPSLESFERMACEDGFSNATRAVNHYVCWSVAGDGRLEGICEDIHLCVAMEESIGQIGVSEDVFVDDHNSEMLRLRI